MNTKPGIRTSEFWANMGVQVVGALAAFNFLTPDQAEATARLVVPVGGLIAMAISQVGYSLSRGRAKSPEPKPMVTDQELDTVIKKVRAKDVLFERGEIVKMVRESIEEYGKKKTLTD